MGQYDNFEDDPIIGDDGRSGDDDFDDFDSNDDSSGASDDSSENDNDNSDDDDTPEFSTEQEAEQFARELFEDGRLEDVVRVCQSALDLYPKAFELWKIFGAALGGLNQTKEARRAFLAALKIVPGDGTAVANYITSCFHDGDVESACEAIELYFDELASESQSFVLSTLGECIQSGLVEESQLPPVILGLFAEGNDVLNELNIQSESNEEYILEDSERDTILKAIDEITSTLSAARGEVEKGHFMVSEAESAFAYVEEKLVEIAIILDSAVPEGDDPDDEDDGDDDNIEYL